MSDTGNQQGPTKIGHHPVPDGSDNRIARFEEALRAHGVEPTPEGITKVLADKNAMHDIFRQSGFTKENFLAATTALHPDLSPSRMAVLGGAVGGGAATVALPLAQLAKNGRVGWRSFAEAAPKAAVAGVLIGAVTGVAVATITNSKRKYIREQASVAFDKHDSTWAENEAKRKARAASTLNEPLRSK